MDYNELKLPVLQITLEAGSVDSGTLRKLLVGRKIVIDIHAVRMALMRYYKQGLLRRVRSGGMFTYVISDRGIHRLQWLEQQARGNTG